MTTAQLTTGALLSPGPIASASDAEQFVIHIMEVMDGLLAVLEEETKLVRAGRLAQAAQLERPKADLTRLYVTDIALLKTNQKYLTQVMPHTIEALHRRHDMFRALLQINLTLLASAHAVSEGIIRGVSAQTDGANGAQSAPPRRAAQPLALSRMP